jgi:hypothetical protein
MGHAAVARQLWRVRAPAERLSPLANHEATDAVGDHARLGRTAIAPACWARGVYLLVNASMKLIMS